MVASGTWSTWRAAGLAVALLAAAWARFPPLLNSNDLNSDGAIVGVQAMHLLAGEAQKNLYGSNYQASVEPTLAAALFVLGGPSPLKVVLVPFFGLLLMVALIYLLLSAETSPGRALGCALTVAFASYAINMPMMYVMRQTMATTLVVGVFVLHQASTSRWWYLHSFFGALVLGLTVFIDTFALVMAPAVALYVLLVSFAGRPGWKRVLLRQVLSGLGALVTVPLASWVGHLGGSEASGLSLANVTRNWPLFRDDVLPFTLGWKVWLWGVPATVWPAPGPLPTLQKWAAMLFVALLCTAVPLLLVPRVPYRLKCLGALGAVGTLTCLATFLGSTAPVDAWSVRYLAPMLWLAPFTLAPLAAVIHARGLAVLLGPYLASAYVSGWATWGPYVKGPLPVLTERGRADGERQVRDFLRQRGIEYATADYWLAYRFSLLFEEKPVVVPLSPSQDRYPPGRAGFDGAKKVAYLFHPSEPRSLPEPYDAMLRAGGAHVERQLIAGFTVLLVDRTGTVK